MTSQPTAAPGTKPRLRGRTPLRLAFAFLLLAIVAVVIGAVLVGRGYKSTINGFQRVPVAQGQKTLTLHEGDYVGYYEVPTGESGQAFVRVAIEGTSGRVVTISQYGKNGSSSSSLTYSYHGRHGEALFKFRISKAGKYRVAVQANNGAPGADVAFGKSIAGGLVAGVLLIVLGVVLFIVFVILLIVGLVKRSHSKRELADPYGGGFGGPPPGYPPPGAPQPGFGQQPGSPQPGGPQPGYGPQPQQYPPPGS